jgi:hypothetical protein
MHSFTLSLASALGGVGAVIRPIFKNHTQVKLEVKTHHISRQTDILNLIYIIKKSIVE